VRARSWLVVPAVLAAVLLAGCHGSPRPTSAPSPSAAGSTSPPVVGGETPPERTAPARPMNGLEKPVRARLASQVAGQGLTLTYLACPRWDGTVPRRMVCRAYVDGLVARVAVRLRAAVEGTAVGFDADLLDGVIATRKLEGTLRRQGWAEADCGSRAAYPAEVGARIVCHVRRPADDRYVVATVSDRSGAVMITDYRPAS
jgi:hypothetical protein